MRTTLTTAPPSFGLQDSSPPTGPAQAAARDLPGRRERKAGRGKTSGIHHGAVWKNPGEAAQRAGKSYGGGKWVGGFARGLSGLGRWLDSLSSRVGQVPLSPPVRSLPLDGGAGGRVFTETAVARESPSTSALHKGAEGRVEFLILRTGHGGSNATLVPEHPVPGARWYVPPEPSLGAGPALIPAYGQPAAVGIFPEKPASSARREVSLPPFPRPSRSVQKHSFPFPPTLQRQYVDLRHISQNKDPTRKSVAEDSSGLGLEGWICLLAESVGLMCQVKSALQSQAS